LKGCNFIELWNGKMLSLLINGKEINSQPCEYTNLAVQPCEISIGNLFHLSDHFIPMEYSVKVTGILPDCVKWESVIDPNSPRLNPEVYTGACSIAHLRPIPLYDYWYCKMPTWFRELISEGYMNLASPGEYIDIKHVHIAQNFYFVITHKELLLNLN
jgi:hypothetical protein